MQSGAVGEHGVDERRRVVEPPSGRRGQPDREPAHRRVVGESDARAFEAGPAVDPHLVGRVHEHIGHARRCQQGLERARADELGPDLHAAARPAPRRRRARSASRRTTSPRSAGATAQPSSDTVDQLGCGHGSTASRTPAATARFAPARRARLGRRPSRAAPTSGGTTRPDAREPRTRTPSRRIERRGDAPGAGHPGDVGLDHEDDQRAARHGRGARRARPSRQVEDDRSAAAGDIDHLRDGVLSRFDGAVGRQHPDTSFHAGEPVQQDVRVEVTTGEPQP